MHDCGCSGAEADQDLVFDEHGDLTPQLPGELLLRPCPISALDGSWLLEIERKTIFAPFVRGPMRIEVGASSLRISGDLYSTRTFFPNVEIPQLEVPPVIGPGGDEPDVALPDSGLFPLLKNWYPSFPMSQYSWYFRSEGATYSGGTLTISIARHLWNRVTKEFTTVDHGRLVLNCTRTLLVLPQVPLKMTGTLSIGGSSVKVTATKTSPLYRGCRVEVDALVNRTWPASATTGSGATVTFRSVYATAGWDVMVATDEVNIPDDADLTNAELQTLLSGHRQPAALGENWRLWLLLGSTQGGLFGIMFDDDTVPREGAAGFADVTLSNDTRIAAAARNQPLDDVPAAFLRTLVHEAGHAFNLFHPKHDVHNPGIGTEIMNQTGDVIGFASATNTYPGNATFAFSEHDRTSLIHSPDPQVRPGWKNFGWGHGSLSSGLPAPVDVAGLDTGDGDGGGELELTLDLPAQAFVGEYVTARLVLTNRGDQARAVTTLLDLARGDVTFLRVRPDGSLDHVLDVAVGCGPRPMVTLEPGQSITGYAQVFFTNQGVTFADPGRHTLVARIEADAFTTVHSAPVTVDVRTPASDTEVDISARMLTAGVGRAFALGDFAGNDAVRAELTGLAEAHASTDTGAAGALVLANALARSFTDFRRGETRDPEPDEAQRFLDLAVAGRSAVRALELAVTVASPTEKNAPVVADTLARVSAPPARRGRGANAAAAADEEQDTLEAERIAADFVSPQPH